MVQILKMRMKVTGRLVLHDFPGTERAWKSTGRAFWPALMPAKLTARVISSIDGLSEVLRGARGVGVAGMLDDFKGFIDF